MSGGHFDYIQYRFDEVADDIQRLIESNNKKDDWGYSQDYSPKTLARFKESQMQLKRAEAMLQRVDWLVSGDDCEESFHERWDVELEKLKEQSHD